MKPHFYTFEKSRCYKTDLWLWRWLPHRLSKRQSLSTKTTVLFRTTLTRTIKLNLNDSWFRIFHSKTGQVAISTKAPHGYIQVTHGYIRVHGEYIWVTWNNIRTTSFPGCSTTRPCGARDGTGGRGPWERGWRKETKVTYECIGVTYYYYFCKQFLVLAVLKNVT